MGAVEPLAVRPTSGPFMKELIHNLDESFQIALRPGQTAPQPLVELEHRRVGRAGSSISATPYAWRDPAMIRPRAWLYGRHYIRKFISGTVSPGGLGKSSLAVAEALALATGRDLIGTKPVAPVGCW